MRKKLLSLFTLALLASGSAWAQETYQIGTAEDMTAFAELVNGGSTTAHAVLTADIDWSAQGLMLAEYAGTSAGRAESFSEIQKKSADVNGDGKVDIADVNILINIVLGSDNATKYAGRADLNKDNKVDIADINAAVAIIVGA